VVVIGIGLRQELFRMGVKLGPALTQKNFEKMMVKNVQTGRNKLLEKKIHNEELLNLKSSPHVIMVFKSRNMKWSGHVARMWEIKMCTF
jgi:hypothetical protein